MKKIILCLSVLMFCITQVKANEIDSIIKKSPVSKHATVSVSIRNLGSGNIFYENESDKLLNPASTMKAFTTPVSYSVLGEDYQFKTQVYKRGNDAYLKLSADPTLTTRNLRHLIRAYRRYDLKQPDKFYIDDSVLDNLEYGIGWQWDDEVSALIPKNSSYNIDGNIYSLAIAPSNDKKSVKVTQPPIYNVGVVNKLKIGSINKIYVQRNFWEGTEKVTLSGTVASPTVVNVATYNPKRYFMNSIKYDMDDANVRYYGVIESKKVPSDATFIQEYITPVLPLYSMIMKNSDNLVAETVFKIAGGKYKNAQGTTNNGIAALKDYYKKIGVDTKDMVIVDASGISRNDLLTTSWMSDALVQINKKDKKFDYKKMYAMPNEGTMRERLFDLRDYLWAKTGTLANTSALTGYITTKAGKEYAFAIIIQNTNLPVSEVKKLEDEIVTTIYNKY